MVPALSGLYHGATALHWVAFVAVAILPAALWAGALTPIISSKTTAHQMLLPGYSNTTILQKPWHSEYRSIYNLNTAEGMFTFMPEYDLQGTMLDVAADASSRINGTNSHAKMDKTGYTYTHRSYGVGASAGLVEVVLLNSTESYVYHELGFLAQTTCIYNSTSNFYLGPNILEGAGFLVEIFEAQGSLPYGNDDVNFATAGFGASGVVALITATVDLRHVLAMTTGATGSDWYAPLNNVQCEISFTPTKFSVNVDTTSRTISVEPLQEVAWPSYGQMMVNRAVGSISTMAQALSTTMYVSIMGQSLMYNIANVQAAQGISSSSNLLGVADWVNSLLDSILVEYSSAQLMIAKESVNSTAESKVTAIVIGSPAYIFPIFTLNLLICLIYLFEVYRTRGWRHLSKFNFTDIKSVIIGTSIGGTAIAERARTLHNARSSVWLADESDSVAGGIHIQLDRTTEDAVAIILASEEAKSRRRYQTATGRIGRASDSGFLLQDFKIQRKPVAQSEVTEAAPSFSSSFQEFAPTHDRRSAHYQPLSP